MKVLRSMLVLILSLLFTGITIAEVVVPPPPINIDISNSNFEVLAPNKYRIRNLTAPSYSGTYWVDVIWDPNQLIFKPTAVGEDSAPSYTDNGNGTVTDNVTGLMWQQEDDNITRTWLDAGTYCSNLTLAGLSDWRLPDEFELMGIVNYWTYGPAIDSNYFPNTSSSFYVASTTVASDSGSAWAVHFEYGNVVFGSKSQSGHVRCVRGGESTADFGDNGNGTVTDKETGLMWQQDDDYIARTWDESLTYCESLTIAGYSNWRLPHVKELRSIVDNTVHDPVIDTTYFPNTDSSAYWSSTATANDSGGAWGVRFSNGSVFYKGKSSNEHVRCVR